MQGEHIATVAEIRASPGRRWSSRCARRSSARCWSARTMTEQDLAQREITIMADKALPYEVLKRVMATCTDADYGKISLAVIQKEKPVAAGYQAGVSHDMHARSLLPRIRAALGGRSEESSARFRKILRVLLILLVLFGILLSAAAAGRSTTVAEEVPAAARAA